MPTAEFGEKLNIDGDRNEFVQLKSKGQKVKFRLVKGAVYDGKHFLGSAGAWNITYCPRVMNDKSCAYCEQYFALTKEIKALGDDVSAGDKEKLQSQARSFKPKITFYYPIIDRADGKGKILKTTLSVRIKLDEEYANDVEVLDYDYVLERTEKSGADYYSLIRMDSKQTVPFTEEEQAEVKRMKEFDLEALVQSKESSLQFSDIAEEVKE